MVSKTLIVGRTTQHAGYDITQRIQERNEAF